MTIFEVLTLIGGLCLFLFGMNVMGQSLERSAGSKLELMLGRLTSNQFMGLLTGLGVTAVIQSSSATTVMVVGFVNSGLMTLKQAINVIMGANIGTTITAWILSLGGISGDAVWLKLLKPSSFTPVLALIGLILYMFTKSKRKKDIGCIFLGFAVLMFGMETMTGAVSGLKDIPAFREMFLAFTNPILGVLVGAVLTAVIQSSSASVGILQALAATGQVSYGAAIPIIMGQNIGTCVTAMISSVGTNKNARRAALVHLLFNILGTTILIIAFYIVRLIFAPALFGEAASYAGIAVAHSAFNIVCTLILFPMSGLIEKLAYKLVPDAKQPEEVAELDDRLLATPAIAIDRARTLTYDMAECALSAISDSIDCLTNYSEEAGRKIREYEDKTDHYEDIIATYLVKLSGSTMSDTEASSASMLLKVIGDFERMGDHAVNILESCEELSEKEISFTDEAAAELASLKSATMEIIKLAYDSFRDEDVIAATKIEALEQVIDALRDLLRTNHIERLRRDKCSIEAGFIWSDLITNMERIADHSSNIAGSVSEIKGRQLNLHESLKQIRRTSEDYTQRYNEYANKYILPIETNA